MSTETVLCHTCRGLKEASGMGGIMKTCWTCKGKGRIVPPISTTQFASDESLKKAVNAQTMECVATVADIALDATDEVAGSIKTKNKRKSRAKVKEPQTIDMFPEPTVDALMQAILDEPRMTPEVWQATYKNVPRLFGINPVTGQFDEMISKVQRAAMRADYAAAQPRVKRKVNVSAAQDAAAEGDVYYAAFKEKEAQLNATT